MKRFGNKVYAGAESKNQEKREMERKRQREKKCEGVSERKEIERNKKT